MSGDVQPRKRKDKKKKKDEFTGLVPPAEERSIHVPPPAPLHSPSENIVIMHAQHDHGTGGHWCAKIVFFVLLGILVGLIGLIILENRGLADLDAPNTESRYAAVFDGWVDEALPDDHHHDKHTFQLTHPDDEDDHDNADESHEVSQEHGSEEQQDDGSEEKDEDSHEEEADDNSEEQDNEDNEEDADEDSEIEDEDNSDEDNNDVSQEDEDDGASDEQPEDSSAEQADDQSQEQGDQNSDEQDDEEDNGSKEDDSNEQYNANSNEQDNADSNEEDNADSNEQDNADSNEQHNAGSNEQNNIDSNEEDNEASNEQNDNNSAEQNEDNSAEQNYDNSAEHNDDASEEHYLKEESKEQDDDDEDSDQENEEHDGGDLSDQENDVELEDIVQAASDESKEKDVSDNEGGNEFQIDDVQDDFSDIEEQISDYAKEDFQEEFLEDEVEQEGNERAHRDDKPYEELDSAEEVVVDNAAGEQEYEERKAKEQQASEEETSNLGVKFGVGVALVAVAHAVLVRKWRNAREQAATDPGERSERRLTLMEDSLLLGTDGKLSPKEASGKKVFFSPTTTEHEAYSEESEVEEEEQQYNYEPPVKSASSFFTKPQPPIVHRAPEEDEDDDIMQVEEFSKKIGFGESQSPPLATQPKNFPVVKNEEIEVSEDEMSEDEMPDDVEVISDDEVSEKNEARKPQAHEPVAQEGAESAEEDEDAVEEEEDEVEEVDEDEDDISDVDDVELMKRLEMKYGKLPDEDTAPEPSRKRKPEGGLSVETWADEPADNQWRQQLDLAQAELDEGKVDEARDKYLRVLRVAPESTRALWGYARSLDVMAERKKSNEVLNAAIAAYNNLLNLGPALSDKLFKDVADRTINRIRFKGNPLLAEPVHKLLIKRFDAEPKHRNDLAISYLMSNNPHKSRHVLKETLERWPNDGVALVHYGFILKTVDSELEEAVTFLQRGLDTGDEGTLDGRFFFQLGDALLMLGRKKEADEVHKTGSLKGIFLSPEQRSLYNVDRLLARPWWNVEQTPYSNLVNDLEKHWREVLKEALSMADEYGAEKEGLKSKGQWTQLELFTRGREIPGRCKKVPVTCNIVRKEAAAKNCRRGQIKFSALTPGTHIRPHVGPTNCRLRAHLGLTNTEGAYLRVHNETRTWHEGKVFIFDDSFEHEVWHNGTGSRIVLIVDLWHPELTPHERSTLPAI